MVLLVLADLAGAEEIHEAVFLPQESDGKKKRKIKNSKRSLVYRPAAGVDASASATRFNQLATQLHVHQFRTTEKFRQLTPVRGKCEAETRMTPALQRTGSARCNGPTCAFTTCRPCCAHHLKQNLVLFLQLPRKAKHKLH